MARPIKTGLECFPQWNPQFYTKKRFESGDFKIRLNALRNSSSSFISRKDVRDYIFERDGHKCVMCTSVKSLSIDHIISVYAVASKLYPVEKLNLKENLQTLCGSCNSKKIP